MFVVEQSRSLCERSYSHRLSGEAAEPQRETVLPVCPNHYRTLPAHKRLHQRAASPFQTSRHCTTRIYDLLYLCIPNKRAAFTINCPIKRKPFRKVFCLLYYRKVFILILLSELNRTYFISTINLII